MPRWLPRRENGGVSSGIQGGWAGPGLLPGGAVSLLCDPTALRELTDLRVHPRSSWGPLEAGSREAWTCPAGSEEAGTAPIPATQQRGPGRGVSRSGPAAFAGQGRPHPSPQCALGTKKTEQVP